MGGCEGALPSCCGSLAELRLLFAERGECDFTEIALSAREALHAEEGSSDLALSAGGMLRHMLVDEMQDTSSGQYELLDLLTHSWDGHTQTLFLVGDPKQSIYLFRQARVERFLRTMKEERLGEIELEPLQLTSNFRSQADAGRRISTRSSIALFPRPDDRRLLGSEGVDVPFVEANGGARTRQAMQAWSGIRRYWRRRIRAAIMRRRRLAAFGASSNSGWRCRCRTERR